MFAVLGDIPFQLGTSFDALDGTFGNDFAEQARIGHKPGLQFTGAKLDEYHLTLVLHQRYCDPAREWQRLQAASRAHQALAFVLGNGDYKGWFVITNLSLSTQLCSAQGSAQALSVEVTLREYTGDPQKPLRPPAVKGGLPNLNQTRQAALPASGLGQTLRQAVGFARQAQSALQTASSVIRVARQMKSNPVAALTRVPGVLTSLGDVAAPLAQSQPWLRQLTGTLPDAIPLLRASGEAATMIDHAQDTLRGLAPGESQHLPGALDTVAGLVGNAVTVYQHQSAPLSRLASRIISRRG
ncbi:phage tail protein [Candidatus Symbiopectobacterium sp.]|uniref:phage tail protein n=1 Tax=Candidatus Symbiopectobacterium sp. TaxID=2816440 RepID=UPI0025BFD4A0|nr:phage tail protein [Candidatus Symbiopectobacterium sp.]